MGIKRKPPLDAFHEAFGKALRHHRTKAGMVQTQIEYDQGGYSKAEGGRQLIDIEPLVRITAQMGIPLSEFFATMETFRTPKLRASLEQMDVLEARAKYHESVTRVVTTILDSTPDAAEQLQAFVQRANALAKHPLDRTLYRDLESRIAEFVSQRPVKRVAKRVRKSS